MMSITNVLKTRKPFVISASHQKWIYLAALSIIWGSSYILIKTGLKGFGYVESATIRLITAGVIAMPLAVTHLIKVKGNQIFRIVLSGLLGMFIPAYFFSVSQQHIQSSVAGMLIAMTPSFTLLISVFFFRKNYSRIQFAGLLLGLLCCITLSLLSAPEGSLSFNPYVLLIVVSTLCYGININFVKHYLSHVPPLHLSSVAVFINGVLALGVFLFPARYTWGFTEENVKPLLALVTLGIFSTALAQVLHTRLIAISSPLFASASTYVIPVVAIFWGVLDNEELTFMHAVVVAGILVSVYMIRKEKKD